MIDLQSLFNKYENLPFKDKLHIFMRMKTVPWDVIIKEIPTGRTIIDVGCGHGLFINLLSSGNARFQRYIGIDVDSHKVTMARQTENEHTSFYLLDLFECKESADVYSFIDVLYLIPYGKQEHILQHVFDRLPQNGYLIVKEVGTSPFWKFMYNRIQETVSVKLLRITYGQKFYFRSEQEYEALLKNIGFSVKTSHIHKEYVHPHVLFVCRKTRSAV